MPDLGPGQTLKCSEDLALNFSPLLVRFQHEERETAGLGSYSTLRCSKALSLRLFTFDTNKSGFRANPGVSISKCSLTFLVNRSERS